MNDSHTASEITSLGENNREQKLRQWTMFMLAEYIKTLYSTADIFLFLVSGIIVMHPPAMYKLRNAKSSTKTVTD